MFRLSLIAASLGWWVIWGVYQPALKEMQLMKPRGPFETEQACLAARGELLEGVMGKSKGKGEVAEKLAMRSSIQCVEMRDLAGE